MCQSGGVNPIRSDALCIANEISDSGQGETYPLLISLCITNGMMCRKSRKSAIGGMNPPARQPLHRKRNNEQKESENHQA